MQLTTLSGLSLLVIEDDVLLRKQLTAHLEQLEADVTGVSTVEESKRLLTDLSFDFVLMDVHLPDGTGLDLLRAGAFPKHTGVIVMTADGGITGAVEAMKNGALDYLVKPFEPEEVPLVIRRAHGCRQTQRLSEHRQREADQDRDTFFFGEALADLEDVLQKILAADRRLQEFLPPVLIQGETGTGKTTIARWIHHRGPRASQPLVEMNCSAVPETLAESELFGHERGAFTDAKSARIGLFEAANGGTLFMDELPSLALPLQAKVLKVIEDHSIRRLGGRRDIPVDVRLVAATSSDLKKLVADGLFREDLYHRLDLFRVYLPPLRERGADVIRLAERLLVGLTSRHRLARRELSRAGRYRLQTYRWPGNVRELAHELERALVFEEGAQLDLKQLTSTEPGLEEAGSAALNWVQPGFQLPESGFSLEDAINTLIVRALGQTQNNISAAARLLGVSRDYVRYRLGNQKKEGGA